MKIAILLPGHLRSWINCKQNFLDMVYDTNHQIDVFVDTYDKVFRSDSYSEAEKGLEIVLDKEQIYKLFDGINVVNFNIEPELVGDAERLQIKKMSNVYDSFHEYQKIHGTYDLVVRSRFDIVFDEKIDYEKIYSECKSNPKLIYIGNGGIDLEENDMFAISTTELMTLYFKSIFDLYHIDLQIILDIMKKVGDRFIQIPMVHKKIIYLSYLYGIQYNRDIGISIVRVDEKGTFRRFK